MPHGETTSVHLVENGTLPRHGWATVGAPCECRVDHPALGHKPGAVALVKGKVLFWRVEFIAKQLRPPFELANQLFCVGIDQKFVWIKTVTCFRLIGAMDAIA